MLNIDHGQVSGDSQVQAERGFEFDRDLPLANIESVRPGMTIFETASKTGTSSDIWFDIWLHCRALRRASLGQPAAHPITEPFA